MRTVLDFVVRGEPISKARPRVTRYGNTYTPASTVTAEAKVRAAYMAKYGVRPLNSGDTVVEADITFWRYERHARDADNLIKTVLDALNGLAYRDDSQVEHGTWQTVWVDRRDQACIHVRLTLREEAPRPPRRAPRQ